jgi:hypothetical protein
MERRLLEISRDLITLQKHKSETNKGNSTVSALLHKQSTNKQFSTSDRSLASPTSTITAFAVDTPSSEARLESEFIVFDTSSSSSSSVGGALMPVSSPPPRSSSAQSSTMWAQQVHERIVGKFPTDELINSGLHMPNAMIYSAENFEDESDEEP